MTTRRRKPRQKVGTIIQYEILYFRCPECREVQMFVSHNEYVKCCSKYCGRRSYHPSCSLSKNEYLVHTWGSLEEYAKWERKFDAYMAKWMAKDRALA